MKTNLHSVAAVSLLVLAGCLEAPDDRAGDETESLPAEGWYELPLDVGRHTSSFLLHVDDLPAAAAGTPYVALVPGAGLDLHQIVVDKFWFDGKRAESAEDSQGVPLAPLVQPWEAWVKHKGTPSPYPAETRERTHSTSEPMLFRVPRTGDLNADFFAMLIGTDVKSAGPLWVHFMEEEGWHEATRQPDRLVPPSSGSNEAIFRTTDTDYAAERLFASLGNAVASPGNLVVLEDTPGLELSGFKEWSGVDINHELRITGTFDVAPGSTVQGALSIFARSSSADWSVQVSGLEPPTGGSGSLALDDFRNRFVFEGTSTGQVDYEVTLQILTVQELLDLKWHLIAWSDDPSALLQAAAA